jgi:hypothetical protein
MCLFVATTSTGCGIDAAAKALVEASQNATSTAKEINKASENLAKGLKDIDPVAEQAKFQAMTNLLAQVQTLSTHISQLQSQLANKIPLECVGKYHCNHNQKECFVKHKDGYEFEFTNEIGDARTVIWDPITRRFNTGWGPDTYFDDTGKIAFPQGLTWWEK